MAAPRNDVSAFLLRRRPFFFTFFPAEGFPAASFLPTLRPAHFLRGAGKFESRVGG